MADARKVRQCRASSIVAIDVTGDDTAAGAGDRASRTRAAAVMRPHYIPAEPAMGRLRGRVEPPDIRRSGPPLTVQLQSATAHAAQAAVTWHPATTTDVRRASETGQGGQNSGSLENAFSRPASGPSSATRAAMMPLSSLPRRSTLPQRLCVGKFVHTDITDERVLRGARRRIPALGAAVTRAGYRHRTDGRPRSGWRQGERPPGLEHRMRSASVAATFDAQPLMTLRVVWRSAPGRARLAVAGRPRSESPVSMLPESPDQPIVPDSCGCGNAVPASRRAPVMFRHVPRPGFADPVTTSA